MILDFRLHWDVTHTPRRATPSPLLALFQSRGREWFPAGGGRAWRPMPGRSQWAAWAAAVGCLRVVPLCAPAGGHRSRRCVPAGLGLRGGVGGV